LMIFVSCGCCPSASLLAELLIRAPPFGAWGDVRVVDSSAPARVDILDIVQTHFS
jgi:hypothetical protein